MAHFGTLRDFRFKDNDIDDIRGSKLYGRNDEKLGEIDDIIFDHSTGEIQYAVVDTGGWLSSRKFLVPADRLHERPGHDDDFAVDLTKAQVQSFPEYNEKHLEKDEDWRKYENRYRAKWETGPVMHKEGSVNVITPEPDEMPPVSGSSSGSMGDVTPTRIAGKFTDTAPGDKTRLRPTGPASDAEDSRLPGQALESRGPLGMGDQRESEHDRSLADQRSMDREREQVRNHDASMVDSTSRSFAGDVSGRVPDPDRTVYTTSGDNINAGDVGYGDVNRTAVPSGTSRDLPPSYRQTADGTLDTSNDLHRPYPVQQGRPQRWRSFEERLRHHRHDATSSCSVCKLSRDKDAA